MFGGWGGKLRRESPTGKSVSVLFCVCVMRACDLFWHLQGGGSTKSLLDGFGHPGPRCQESKMPQGNT